jgi:hypothetical protein
MAVSISDSRNSIKDVALLKLLSLRGYFATGLESHTCISNGVPLYPEAGTCIVNMVRDVKGLGVDLGLFNSGFHRVKQLALILCKQSQ